MLPALARAREAARRASCANNLKQLGLSLFMYAYEHRGKFPQRQVFKGTGQLSPEMMFNGPAMIPEYVSDVNVVWCPSWSAPPDIVDGMTWQGNGDGIIQPEESAKKPTLHGWLLWKT